MDSIKSWAQNPLGPKWENLLKSCVAPKQFHHHLELEHKKKKSFSLPLCCYGNSSLIVSRCWSGWAVFLLALVHIQRVPDNVEDDVFICDNGASFLNFSDDFISSPGRPLLWSEQKSEMFRANWSNVTNVKTESRLKSEGVRVGVCTHISGKKKLFAFKLLKY